MHHKLRYQKARIEKARELYKENKAWSRKIAWKILFDIAHSSSGCYSEYEQEIEAALEENDSYEAFRLLGSAAHKAIEDLEYALENNYFVSQMDY